MGIWRDWGASFNAILRVTVTAEECDCVCNDEGLCCCHGEKDARTSSSSDTPETPLRMTPDFEEFDGVDDILAVR
ncbi:uncharacterized protein TNIN_450041 [Trichonephila inaurata madagascariensis]|uniref:Uncharacterized protein n=1 Tax=Trichonephila inaurata madagascariensis TaxID=2747483 RepID=A0A8X7BPM5_9ARAC|nr:uncharacterized protein TNIN_450041 [Trichonephila inaurata madagascariensis]